MVAVVIDQADAFDLGAFFDDGRGALDLQVLDQQHAVAVGQWRAVGILDEAGAVVFIGNGFCMGRPFMGAIGAYQQIAIGIGIVQAALGARGEGGCAQGFASVQRVSTKPSC
ncbi:hypothetical protein SDC9_186271 [bioreactor metagenome]|uniref:Uncharacterized protein n=1 Tax=bioreactor metagenome TaxID=1076179 RepID=A0A645HJG8_9ZZZZ